MNLSGSTGNSRDSSVASIRFSWCALVQMSRGIFFHGLKILKIGVPALISSKGGSYFLLLHHDRPGNH
jgi:hypothetical protein